MLSIRTRFATLALAAVVATTSFGFAAADEAHAAKGKTAAAKVKKDGKRKALAKASARKIG